MLAHPPHTTCYRLSYTSQTDNTLGVIALSHLLNEAKKRNQAWGVGSVLMSTGAEFGQVLEGAPHVLASIWELIQSDTRHHKIERLSFHPISQRLLREGSMLFAGNHDLCSRQVLSYIHTHCHQLFPEAQLQTIWIKIKKQIAASACLNYADDGNSFSTPSTFGSLVGSFN